MTSARTFATPAAFRIALEERLKRQANAKGTPLNRHRKLFVIDRFLGRLNAHFGESLLAKGGVALELGLELARTTRDLDVSIHGFSRHDPQGLLGELQDAARRDVADQLSFEVRLRAEDEADIGDAVYGGFRFRVEVALAGRPYEAFPLDVAFADALTGEPALWEGTDLLDFVGAPRSRARLYPRETHVAEKLHAYTRPMPRPNSRVKDLVDLALLGRGDSFDAPLLRDALARTFTRRGTHDVPDRLPQPPPTWERPYQAMRDDNALPWSTIADVYEMARSFLDPLLQGTEGSWVSSSSAWVRE